MSIMTPVHANTNDNDDSQTLLLLLLQNCESITNTALSLKTIIPKFEDIDSAIEREEEIKAWLERQCQNDGDLRDSSSTMNESALLESTWKKYQETLLGERVRMALSAEAVLLEEDLHVLTQEALMSRDDLADQVTRLQNELSVVQLELETTTRTCRVLEDDIRVKCSEIASSEGKPRGNVTQQEQIRTLKCLLADLIVGAELDLYNNSQLADTFLKLDD